MSITVGLGACTGAVDVPTRSTGQASTTDSSRAAQDAWFVATRPIVAARNISYDTVMTITLPGEDEHYAHVVVADRYDREHGVADQFISEDVVSPDRAPTSYVATIVQAEPGKTYVSVRKPGHPASWRKVADHHAAVALLPVELAHPSGMPVALWGFEPRALVREYGRLCIKGALLPEPGLKALGFGRWLNNEPGLAQRLTGTIPTTVVLREDGSIEKVEVTGVGHTLRTSSGQPFDGELASAVARSHSVVEMETYDVDMKIEVPREGQTT